MNSDTTQSKLRAKIEHQQIRDISAHKFTEEMIALVNAEILSVLERLKVAVHPHDGNDMIADLIEDEKSRYKGEE